MKKLINEGPAIGDTVRSAGRERAGVPTHHGSCGGCRLGRCSLVDLVLGGLDLGLQMGRGVEVFALFPRASPFDVIHAHGDRVVVGVDHGAVRGMSKPTIVFSPVAIATLVFSTHLQGHQVRGSVNMDKQNLSEDFHSERKAGEKAATEEEGKGNLQTKKPRILKSSYFSIQITTPFQ